MVIPEERKNIECGEYGGRGERDEKGLGKRNVDVIGGRKVTAELKSK